MVQTTPSLGTMTTAEGLQSGLSEVLGHRKVSKGDILLTSEPFVYLVNSQYKGSYCDTCFDKRTAAFQRCSGCSFDWYCNTSCQRASWSLHKHECKNLRKLKPKVPPDTALLLAKILIRLGNGGDKVEEKWADGTKCRKFKDLMNHYTDIKKDAKRQEHLASLAVVLREYLGDQFIPNVAELQGIYGRVLINTFNICDADQISVGTGLYLAASIFDHSCHPNAYVTFRGTRLVCRSLVDWDVLDWSKVRISYIDILKSTKERKSDLCWRYYFECDCNFCNDEERLRIQSSIVCENPSCMAPVYVDIHNAQISDPIPACRNCGYSDFKPFCRRVYKEVAEFSQDELDSMENQYYYDRSMLILDKQGDLFHKSNVLKVRALDAAFEAAIDLQLWDKAVCHGLKNIDGMKYHYGQNHPSYAWMLMKLGKMVVLSGLLQDGLKLLNQAEPIIRISHGTDHPIYHDLKELINMTIKEIESSHISSKKLLHNTTYKYI